MLGMKQKLALFLILFVFACIALTKTFAQESSPCPVNENSEFIRAAISTNNFGTLEYKEISFTSEGSIKVINKDTFEEVITTLPKDILKFQISDKNTLSIFQNEKKISESIMMPFVLKTENDEFIQIVGLKRAGKPAVYRGYFEILKTPGKTGKFSVINVLPLEEYLRGVVPNELPVSFGLEALKAQAVAARNYALRPRDKVNPLYDVCDSVQSQVYFGANTEKPLSDVAVQETFGLLGLHNANPILALYSSTAGGYTESYQNAFAEPGTENFPAKSLPYLTGKPDISGMPPLYTEEASREFYTSVPSSYDNDSAYFRWTRSWTEEELRKELNQSLPKFKKSSLVSVIPVFSDENSQQTLIEQVKYFDIGKIKEIKVISRGVSGKIIEICVIAEKATVSVKKELLIRRIFTNMGKALPSANVVFDNIYDDKGNFVKVDAFGGGLGHGVGMSQYGAGSMAKSGYSFDKILQHYYDGISIGTMPVSVTNQSAPVIQKFFVKNAKADLIIENTQNVDNFNFMINSKKIVLNRNYLPCGKIRMPLNGLLLKGLNEIVYNPVEKNRGKSLKVWVEVVKSEK
jgi:SpoIID/LytB domain protein